jgi:hypothetical protein
VNACRASQNRHPAGSCARQKNDVSEESSLGRKFPATSNSPHTGFDSTVHRQLHFPVTTITLPVGQVD